MSGELRNTNSADEGLLSLVMLLRFHGLGADPQQIRHRLGASAIGIPEMLRCARELGLKAQSRATTWKRLISTPVPAIVGLRDGGFLLLGKVGDDKALVQSPLSPKPDEGAGLSRPSPIKNPLKLIHSGSIPAVVRGSILHVARHLDNQGLTRRCGRYGSFEAKRLFSLVPAPW
jgi:Peptidase C39 family